MERLPALPWGEYILGDSISLFEGNARSAHLALTCTCLMAASFLGPLRGGLAATEGICVTDVLALELGRRGAGGIRARSLSFQPSGETELLWLGKSCNSVSYGTRSDLASE